MGKLWLIGRGERKKGKAIPYSAVNPVVWSYNTTMHLWFSGAVFKNPCIEKSLNTFAYLVCHICEINRKDHKKSIKIKAKQQSLHLMCRNKSLHVTMANLMEEKKSKTLHSILQFSREEKNRDMEAQQRRTTAQHPGGSPVPSELRVTSQASGDCDSSVPAGGRTLINVTISCHQIFYDTED